MNSGEDCSLDAAAEWARTAGNADPAFRAAIDAINQAVQDGNCLSRAMRKFPQYFDEKYANLVREGEVNAIWKSHCNDWREDKISGDALRPPKKSISSAYPGIVRASSAPSGQ